MAEFHYDTVPADQLKVRTFVDYAFVCNSFVCPELPLFVTVRTGDATIHHSADKPTAMDSHCSLTCVYANNTMRTHDEEHPS